MYIYGLHPVEEVLRYAPDQVLALVHTGEVNSALSSLLDSARARKVPTKKVARSDLERLVEGGNHQNIALEVRAFDYTPLSEVLERLAGQQTASVWLLDQVQDTGNLGAILRSAAAFQTDAVVIPKRRAAGVTPAVVRASAGLAYRVPVVEVTNLSRTLRTLKDSDFWIAGLVAPQHVSESHRRDGSSPHHGPVPTLPLWEMDFALRCALVFGSEHSGLRRVIREGCDFEVFIPLRAQVDSLNVSVVCGMAGYEIARQQSLLPEA